MSYNAKCDGTIIFKRLTRQEQESVIRILSKAGQHGFFESVQGNKEYILSVITDANYDEGEVTCALEKLKNKFPVTAGSLEYSGEDDELWRIVFKDGEWVEEVGRIEYSDIEYQLISFERALDMLCTLIAHDALAQNTAPSEVLAYLKKVCGMSESESAALDSYMKKKDFMRETARKEGKTNTQVNYLYRDGSNYKLHQKAVVKGIATQEDIAKIMDALEDGERFVPEQVGLDVERFADWTEDDTAWCELYKEGNFLLTMQAVTVPDMTISELAERFHAAKGKWKPEEYI